jgi:hypothetical protein
MTASYVQGSLVCDNSTVSMVNFSSTKKKFKIEPLEVDEMLMTNPCEYYDRH